MAASRHPSCLRTAALATLLAAGATPALAGSLSFTGSLAAANDAVLIPFQLAAPAALVVQSWGYGGTAGAPGGRNAAGAVIGAGGLDSYLSLFAGSGAGATFLVSNDDGPCPPATSAPACYDARLAVALLPAGHYTLALTQPFNFSFAENLGSGTLGDGFIGLEADFHGRSSAWALDISSVALVPEPAAPAMLTLGMIVLALGRRAIGALDHPVQGEGL